MDLLDKAVASTCSTLLNADGSALTSADVADVAQHLRASGFEAYARGRNSAEWAFPTTIAGGGKPVYVVHSGDDVGPLARIYIREMVTAQVVRGR